MIDDLFFKNELHKVMALSCIIQSFTAKSSLRVKWLSICHYMSWGRESSVPTLDYYYAFLFRRAFSLQFVWVALDCHIFSIHFFTFLSYPPQPHECWQCLAPRLHFVNTRGDEPSHACSRRAHSFIFYQNYQHITTSHGRCFLVVLLFKLLGNFKYQFQYFLSWYLECNIAFAWLSL